MPPWFPGKVGSPGPGGVCTGRPFSSKPLAQFTLANAGLLPDIPIAHTLAGTDTGRRAIEVLESDSILAWPVIAPPDLPRESES